MKPSLLLFLCVLLLSVATAPGNEKSSGQSAEGTKLRRLTERWFEAFNKHDVETVRDTYTEDAVMISPPFEKPTHGKKAIAEHYAGLFRGIPDIRDSIISIDIIGEKVFVEFISTGTLQQPAQDGKSPAQSKRFTLNLISILYYKGDLIYKDVTYYDQEQISRQME